jgi:hypothetical protein
MNALERLARALQQREERERSGERASQRRSAQSLWSRVGEAHQAASGRNLFRNPSLAIVSGLYADGAIVADTDSFPFPMASWRVHPSAGGAVTVNWEYSGGNLPAGVGVYGGLKITGTTGLASLDLCQYFEAYDAMMLLKRTLTASLYVYNGSGAAMTPTLDIVTANAQGDFTATTSRLTATLQACPDGEWSRVSHTFDPSDYDDIGNGLGVSFRFPGLGDAGKHIILTGAQLEPGEGITPFQGGASAYELPRIQRYFVSLPQHGNGASYVGYGHAIRGDAARIAVSLPQTMRATPIFAVSSATDWNLTDGNSGEPVTGFVVNSLSGLYCVVEAVVAGGLTTGQPYFLQQQNSATFFFIAEL